MARIPLVTEFESKGLDRAIKEFKNLDTTAKKVGAGLKKAFVPATAALGGLTAAAGLSLKAAAEDAAQQAELARQLEATTGATEAQVAAVEQYIAQTELAAGVTDAELRPAFANLVRATGDVTESQELMALALDVAAGTGKDLEGVTEALQEAIQGEVGPLKELDRSLTDVIASGADTDEVLGQLADTFGGAAAESTETVEGKFKLMKIQLDNTKESIGKALLPILEKLLPKLESLATFVSENTELILIIGGVIGAFAAAIVAANAAMAVYNAVMTVVAIKNAIAASSFTALWVATGVGVIVAIIAALVVLQAKFDIIGKTVDLVKWAFDKAWGALKDLINGAIDGINTLIGLINKIPGVDIPEIKQLGDDAETAAGQVGELLGEIVKANDEVDYGTEPMGRFESSVRNVKDESSELATTLGRVDEAFDPLNEGIETATTRLDKFFDSLDRQAATDEFIEDLTDIAEQLNGVREGTEQWTELQNEAYEALRQLRDERDDLSDSFLEVLKLEIDTGDLDYAVELLAKVDAYLQQGFAPGFQGLPIPTSNSDLLAMGFNAPSMGTTTAAASDGMTGATNHIYLPAGTDNAWILDGLTASAKRDGSLDISTSSTVR